MNIRNRNALNDYLTAEQRMECHRDRKPINVDWPAWIAGTAAVSLALLTAWLLWQISTPAGMAMIGDLARYIWAESAKW